jgi:hypothetical protein
MSGVTGTTRRTDDLAPNLPGTGKTRKPPTRSEISEGKIKAELTRIYMSARDAGRLCPQPCANRDCWWHHDADVA